MPPPNNSTNQQNQSNSDDRILLEMLAKKLGDLAPLHDDMIKLLTTVDNMKTNEAELRKFKDKIMDPENGLFSKIQGVDHRIELMEKSIESLQESVDDLPTNKDLGDTDQTISDLRKDHDSIRKLLEDVGGKNLEEIGAIVKLKANMGKVYWALVVSVLLSIGKLLLDVFKASH